MPQKAKAKEDTGSATVAPWDEGKWECRYTYLALLANEQFTEQFSLIGERKMGELNFWNKVSSPNARSLAAGGLATNIDKMYTQILPHTYEEGYNFHRAVEDMKTALTTQDKTVAQLAQDIDKIYLWRGETH